MAADIKRLADRTWEWGNSRSKVFNADKVIYYFNQEKDGHSAIHVKYKKSDADIVRPLDIPISPDNLDLTEQERKDLTSIATIQKDTSFTPEEIARFKLFLAKLEEKLKLYMTDSENKDEAITLLKEYREKRFNNEDEYQPIIPWLTDFFKDTPLQPLLGIPKKDKLVAVDKIILWLTVSKTDASPILQLDDNDICALTDKDLGDRIRKVEELDPEFKAIFAQFKATFSAARIPPETTNSSLQRTLSN